jgi:hypothetical protein
MFIEKPLRIPCSPRTTEPWLRNQLFKNQGSASGINDLRGEQFSKMIRTIWNRAIAGAECSEHQTVNRVIRPRRLKMLIATLPRWPVSLNSQSHRIRFFGRGAERLKHFAKIPDGLVTTIAGQSGKPRISP